MKNLVEEISINFNYISEFYNNFPIISNLTILITIIFFIITMLPKKLFTLITYIEKNKMPLLLLFTVAFLSGTYIYAHYYNLSFLQAIYYGLTQFVLEVKTPKELSIETDLALDNYHMIYWSAFLAMIASSLTVLLLFKDEILGLKARAIAKKKSKIIICGLGDNNRYFIDNLLENKNSTAKVPKDNKKKPEEYIYIIENNIENPYIDVYNKKENVSVVVGSALDEGLLKKAKVCHCKYVIISTGSDITNLSILSEIRRLKKVSGSLKKFINWFFFNTKNKTELISIYTHVSNRSSEIFFDAIDFLGKEQSMNTHFYSYNELASRHLFKNFHLIEGVNTVTNDEEVHILIIGFGDLGQEVALQAALQGHFYNKKPIKITVIDKDHKKFESFRTTHWNIDKVCQFKTYRCNIDTPHFYKRYFKDKSQPTHVVFALGDDMLTFSSLSIFIHKLKQNQKKYNKLIPNIAVRFKKDVSEKIVKTYTSKLLPKKFYIFGITSTISTKKYIIEHKIDELAKSIHEGYRKTAPEESPWEDIENFKKDSNRSAADNKVIKDDTIKRLEISKTELEKFKNPNDALINKHFNLIDMEHRRWNAFHYLNGWEHGVFNKNDKSNKNVKLKLHGCLINTKLLKEFEKTMGENKNYYYTNDLRNFTICLNEESENGD